MSRDVWFNRGIDCEQTLDEIVALESCVAASETEVARLRAGLEHIRDRYVRHVPGKERPMCTLCGADDGTHADDKNCGLASLALAPPAPTPPPCASWCGTTPETHQPARSKARIPPMPNPQGVEVGHRYRSGSQVGEVIKLAVNSRGQDTAEFRWADGSTTVLAVCDLDGAGFARARPATRDKQP